MTIPIIQQSVNEINFFINYITDNIAKYKLSELTNGNMGDIPNIIGAHPLAMEYGNMLNADEAGNYTSILPAIGVELIDDNDYNQQYLGSGYKTYEISQIWIDAIEAILMKNRFGEGVILSDSNLDEIKTMKADKDETSQKLWAKSQDYLMNSNINISVWSDNWQITNILYLTLKGLLQDIKHKLAENGAKNATLSGQGSIYNYEFNQTLFGAEFNLRFINNHKNITVDDSLLTISKVDESKVSTDENSKPTFVPLQD